jgi:hypothetical protein
MVCKPGTCVSVANKDALDLRAYMECKKHKKAVRGNMSSAKVTIIFVINWEANQMMMY